jgi:hypothetical protein
MRRRVASQRDAARAASRTITATEDHRRQATSHRRGRQAAGGVVPGAADAAVAVVLGLVRSAPARPADGQRGHRRLVLQQALLALQPLGLDLHLGDASCTARMSGTVVASLSTVTALGNARGEASSVSQRGDVGAFGRPAHLAKLPGRR